MDSNSPEYRKLEQAALGDFARSDAKVMVDFTLAAALDRAASDLVKRSIFIDQVCITERVAGIVDYTSRVATDADKRRYPIEWKRFEEGGPSVATIPGIKPSEVEMLRARRAYSIQDAAAIEEVHDEIRNAVMLAKRWLLVSTGEKPRIRLEAA